MSRAQLVGSVFVASLLALGACMLVGPPLVISLRMWVTCFGVIAALLMLRYFYAAVPVLPEQRRALFGSSAVAEQTSADNRRVRMLHGIVLRARDNDRSFRSQLQPQLVLMARHFLRLNHGIDLDHEPGRAANVLGDLGWLIATGSGSRRPTPSELDQFVRVLTLASPQQTSAPQGAIR